MKRGDNDRRKTDALVKIVEGEVMLLADTIADAIHWDRPNEVRAALRRIQYKCDQIAKTLDVDMMKGEQVSR